MVEFRRTSGNCFQFQEVYKKITPLLTDLVWDSTVEVEEEKRPNNTEGMTVMDSVEELISDEAMMI